MPILVGGFVLVLLAALAYGIYVIVQNLNADDETPASVPTSAAPAAPQQTAGAGTPSAESTTPTPEPTSSTTDPARSEVTIPALRGLALADAQAALGRTGLSYRLIYRTDDAAPNTVIDSDPPEGQEVPPDTVVTLVVAASTASTVPSASASS